MPPQSIQRRRWCRYEPVQNCLANVFLQFPARGESKDPAESERFGQSFLVLDRDLNIQVTQVRPRIAFGHVHRSAMRFAGGIEPGLIVEADRVDYQRIAIPLSNRDAGTGLRFHLKSGLLRSPVQEE